MRGQLSLYSRESWTVDKWTAACVSRLQYLTNYSIYTTGGTRGWRYWRLISVGWGVEEACDRREAAAALAGEIDIPEQQDEPSAGHPFT